MRHERCAVNHTLEGGPCRRPAAVGYLGERICDHHARRFASVNEDYDAYLEAVVFRIEVWLRSANREGDTETVRGLEAAREKAALKLDLARVDYELANWEQRIAAYGVRALFEALKRHDPRAGEESEAVAALAAATAKEIGLTEQEITEVEQAALLRHVGKIKIPTSILEKPGPLEEGERKLLEEHPLVGARMVMQVDGVSHLAPLIRAQQEHWDGWGYPDGLKGEKIPQASRIIFACGAYYAMISNRPFRETMSAEAATEELRKNAGTQFCPRTVEALLTVIDRAHTTGSPRQGDPATMLRSTELTLRYSEKR